MRKILNQDKKFTDRELAFIKRYIETGNATQSYLEAGYKVNTDVQARSSANRLRKKEHIAAEILRRQEEMAQEAQITGAEVMNFFASVMRGEVKDQFGIETSVSDRIKAATELAKRTVDIESRLKGNADQRVEVSLDWGGLQEDTEDTSNEISVEVSD